MIGARIKLLLAVCLVLTTATSAHAWWGWGWRFGGYRYYGASYYYAPAYYRYYAPSYAYCPSVPVYPTVRPVPFVTPAKKAAEKVPTSKEPPVANAKQKGPTVTESRSTSRSIASSEFSTDRCKVGFWNLTGRDITLRVDGQPRTLAKNHAVTLELARTFSWQIDGERTTNELVPAEQAFHEVILRQ